MKVIRSSSTYNPKENWGEVNLKPSETVPDQTIPLRKLLENYTRGALPVGVTPYWDETEEVDIKSLDLVDLQELGMAARRSIDDFKESQQAKQKEQEALLARYKKFGDPDKLEIDEYFQKLGRKNRSSKGDDFEEI